MLNDWIYWLSEKSWYDITLMLIGLVLLDGPRYCACTVLTCLYDWCADLVRTPARICRGGTSQTRSEGEYSHCPSICVVIAGLNEGDSIASTVDSIIGSYPRLEIVVVDDGSDDGMSEAALPYARRYPNVRVVTRPWRGGKSSALNIGLIWTKADIIVAVDADSHLENDALWEIVQPFADPKVGVVSATVVARNAFKNLTTWLQGFEYAQSIFVGRRISAGLRVLPIASGAFAAYRREAVERLKGWDVGPGEDLDLTLKIRKLGYHVAFAQYATCHTDLPTKFTALLKQRRRWDGDGPVRHYMRKHNDLTNPFAANFRASNFVTFWDAIVFNLLAGFGLLLWMLYVLVQSVMHSAGYGFLTVYAFSLIAEVLSAVALQYYSPRRRHDLLLSLALPLVPIYRLVLMFVRVYANTNEIFFRASFYEKHVPPHVAQSTWHW